MALLCSFKLILNCRATEDTEAVQHSKTGTKAMSCRASCRAAPAHPIWEATERAEPPGPQPSPAKPQTAAVCHGLTFSNEIKLSQYSNQFLFDLLPSMAFSSFIYWCSQLGFPTGTLRAGIICHSVKMSLSFQYEFRLSPAGCP